MIVALPDLGKAKVKVHQVQLAFFGSRLDFTFVFALCVKSLPVLLKDSESGVMHRGGKIELPGIVLHVLA